MRKKLTLHSILYAVLASGLLLVSGEEISWGQRIFNMATPAFFEQHNWQHEISLHNLDVIQLSLLNKIYILIGAYGAFAWLFLRPFAARLKKESCHVVNFIVPDWYMSSYFFFVFLVYTLLNFIKQSPGGFLVWKDQEPTELLLSMGFLLFVVKNYFILRLCPINASHFGHLGKLNFATMIISARQSHHVVQSDARVPESNISNQEENVSDSMKKPMGLQKIWDNYRIYIIGITVVIVAIGIVFAVSEKTKVSISDKKINRVETPKIEVSATSNNVSADDLFNSALAICSGKKCINPKKATEYLNQAIKLRPDFVEAYGMRGNVYQKRGQYQNAVEDYNEVLKLNPGDPRAYFNRGTAYLMLGNEKLGCPDLHKACDLGYCDALEWAKSKGICR